LCESILTACGTDPPRKALAYWSKRITACYTAAYRIARTSTISISIRIEGRKSPKDEPDGGYVTVLAPLSFGVSEEQKLLFLTTYFIEKAWSMKR
jgi:hypothetical protein